MVNVMVNFVFIEFSTIFVVIYILVPIYICSRKVV